MENPDDRREIKQTQLDRAEWLVDYYRHAWKMGHHEIDALRRLVAGLRAENIRLWGTLSERDQGQPKRGEKVS